MNAEQFIAPEAADLTVWLTGYEVSELVACGGMGAVYRARQLSLDRWVAVKVLRPELAADGTFRECFEAEAKAMAQLAHSNLVGVYDFGSVEDMLYLVMEFVEGNTLYQSGHGRMVEAAVAVDLVKALARGLGEAHNHGIVHRDIKPANILVTPELVPKLGDFGLAVPSSEVESGLMMGTPAYLAPEVLADPRMASFAADTYALGVILYELLTGQSVEDGDALGIGSIPLQYGLRDLVKRATSANTTMRFQDGAEMAEALAKWEKQRERHVVPTVRPSVPPPTPTRTVVVRSGVPNGLLAALGLIALLAVVAILVLKGDKTNAPEDQPVVTAGVAEEDPLTVSPRAGGTAPETPAIPTDAPPETEPDDAPAPVDLDKLRDKHKALVMAESENLQADRQANREEFESALGHHSELLRALASADSRELPRFFLPGTVTLSGAEAGLCNKYMVTNQEESDRQFSEHLRELHAAALNEYPEDAGVPNKIHSSPEPWLEWLGLDPLEVGCRSLCGKWKQMNEQKKFVVKHDGSAHWLAGMDRPGLAAVVELAAPGRIILRGTGGDDREWILRWRNDVLAGTDAEGNKCRFRREPFDFSSLIDESAGDGSLPTGELATLRAKFLEALEKRIGPVVTGYLEDLEKADQRYAGLGQKTSRQRIAREMEWVRSLAWRDGRLKPGLLREKATDVPVGEDPRQQIFLRDFCERYEKTQGQYVALLKEMKNKRVREDRPFVAIELELERLDPDAGIVQARHVKLEILRTPSGDVAAIAELEILGRNGKPLDRSAYRSSTCSSFSDFPGKSPEPRVVTAAFDGNPVTEWHTHWDDRTKFPHWIAVRLGRVTEISGFKILPSQNENNRGNVVQWVLYTSQNGGAWQEVARGTFPQGQQWNEHRGLKEI